MCGIVGYIGTKTNAIETIISGLEVLEYRGYDSAGIAYLSENKVNIIGDVVHIYKQKSFAIITIKTV